MELEGLRLFIGEYGPVLGTLLIGLFLYFLMRRSASKTEDDAKAAATETQRAVTLQFTALSTENRSLHVRIDALEAAKDAIEAEHARIVAELTEAKRAAAVQQAAMKAAQDKAALLEVDVKALTEKVATLETERDARAGELERERQQVQTTSRSLRAANEKIAQLQERVHALEIENSAFALLLEKIQVIKVDPDPDPPEPPPVALHIESETHTTSATTTSATTSTDTEAA